MKTSIIAFGVAVLFLGMGMLSVFQGNKIQLQQRVLAEKNVEIAELNLTIDEEVEKSVQLRTLNEEYEDSIQILNERIAILEKTLEEKDKEIKYLKGKLKRRNIKYQELKDKIAILYRKEKLDKAAIAKLENEKESLRKQISMIKNNTEEVFAARSVAEEEIEDHKQQIQFYNLHQDIANNTKVLFQEVTGKKFRSGRKINKMRKNMNGWQYTDFKFTLSHPNHQALLDKSFVLKIYDKEHKIPLAYLEQNPMFNSNQQKGLPFQFDGNIIELTYCNMQKKVSENFEARIFLLHNGEEIALDNGTLPIITNGQFVNI